MIAIDGPMTAAPHHLAAVVDAEQRLVWRRVIAEFVHGEPVAQSRPRFAMRGGRPMVYEPAEVTAWKREIAVMCTRRQTAKLRGPIRVEMVFYLPRPKKLNAKSYGSGPVAHTVKPDIDNLAKAAMDGLLGAEWADDAQVQSIAAEKWYAAKGQPCGMAIALYAAEKAEKAEKTPEKKA